MIVMMVVIAAVSGVRACSIPSVPANVLLVKNSSVVGVYWGAHFQKEPAVIAQSFRELRRLAEGNLLSPIPIGKEVLALEQVPRAMYEMANGKVIGKIIVRAQQQANL